MNTALCPGQGYAYEFESTIDCPVGRTDCVSSGITGKPLRYFTPDPLPDLLERSRLIAPISRAEVNPLVALLLIRAAARNSSTGHVDLPQARRFLSVLQGALTRPAIDDLISLAKAVNPKIAGLRQEIIFVGGVVPSSARHIYAPHPALPALMGSLVAGLASAEVQSCDPLIASAVAGAFCAYMHPFADGNGRWSRLVSASLASTPVRHWPVMIGVTFQNACKRRLSETVLAEATSCGLRHYVEAALRFEAALVRALSSSAALDCAIQLAETLKVVARNQSGSYTALGRLYATGRLPVAELRATFGLSQRAATGLAQRTVDAVHGMVSVSDGFLDGRHLIEQVDADVELAANAAFG